MAPKDVLLLSGGGGPEHSISLVSAQSLRETLEGSREFSAQFQVTSLEIKEGPWWEGLGAVDFVIPCLHGPPGESGEIQGVLQALGWPYLGSGPGASALCFNKVATKLIVQAQGIPVAPFMFLTLGDDRGPAWEFFRSRGRAFVKAPHQGSSLGCSLVEKDLDQALDLAFQFSPWALVEEVISGRELEVAIYEWKGKLRASHPGEVIPFGAFYDYDEKYSPESQAQVLTRATVPEEVVQKVQSWALRAFHILGARDLARADFFLRDNGDILFNEINTFPGMTPISLFPRMLKASGGDLAQMVGDIASRRIEGGT